MLPVGQYRDVLTGLDSDTSYEVAVVAHYRHDRGTSESIMAKTASMELRSSLQYLDLENESATSQ